MENSDGRLFLLSVLSFLKIILIESRQRGLCMNQEELSSTSCMRCHKGCKESRLSVCVRVCVWDRLCRLIVNNKTWFMIEQHWVTACPSRQAPTCLRLFSHGPVRKCFKKTTFDLNAFLWCPSAAICYCGSVFLGQHEKENHRSDRQRRQSGEVVEREKRCFCGIFCPEGNAIQRTHTHTHSRTQRADRGRTCLVKCGSKAGCNSRWLHNSAEKLNGIRKCLFSISVNRSEWGSLRKCALCYQSRKSDVSQLCLPHLLSIWICYLSIWGQTPTENIWSGDGLFKKTWNMIGQTFCLLSHCRQANQISSFPVEPLRRSSRLPIGALDVHHWLKPHT